MHIRITGSRASYMRRMLAVASSLPVHAAVIAARSTTFRLSWRGYISFCRSLAILDYCNWVLKVRGKSSDNNLGGDHPWLGGTTYGAVDSPAGPSMAAIDIPAGRTIYGSKICRRWSGRTSCGGTIGGVTVPLQPLVRNAYRKNCKFDGDALLRPAGRSFSR